MGVLAMAVSAFFRERHAGTRSARGIVVVVGNCQKSGLFSARSSE
jgi:hypothetical protein